jgi:hypothetical protein
VGGGVRDRVSHPTVTELEDLLTRRELRTVLAIQGARDRHHASDLIERPPERRAHRTSV